MSEFNKEYIQFLKDHDEEFKQERGGGYTTVLNAYLDWVEGNVLCACELGCNHTVARNGAKLIAIIRAVHLGMSDLFIEALALKDPAAFTYDLGQENWAWAKAKRAPKT